MKYCPNCNTGNKPEARYCESCGQKFADTSMTQLPDDSKTSSVNKTALVSSILKTAAVGTVGKVGSLLKQSVKVVPLSPLEMNQLWQLLQEKMPQKPLSPERKHQEEMRQEQVGQQQLQEQVEQQRR